MSKAVQFDSYGGVDVLEVRDVPRPVPEAGEVLVEVRAAGINPSEAVIRSGALADQFPATFPSGQGSDLAGVVAELGSGVGDFAVGDEVIGFSMRRSSHAEYVTVPATQLTPKPSDIPWEVAGSLFVVGATAYAAVAAMRLVPGETVAIAGAAGGVGSIAVNSPAALAPPSWASPVRPTTPGSPIMARSQSTTVTTCRPGCAPQHRPDTSTPYWTSSVVDMSRWRSRTSNCRVTGSTPSPISLPWRSSGSCPQGAPMPPLRLWWPSWPTSSHGVSWKCRSPESSPSTMCATRSGRSNSDTPAASWCCDHERDRSIAGCAHRFD